MYVYFQLYPLGHYIDLDEAIAMIHKAIRSAINYIDTAPYYGQGRAEEVLGMAFINAPRAATI